MEGYKTKMVEELKDLRTRLHNLADKIEKFEKDFTFDPVELSLMRAQLEHMNAYYSTLLLRCEFCFTLDEFDTLKESLDFSE